MLFLFPLRGKEGVNIRNLFSGLKTPYTDIMLLVGFRGFRSHVSLLGNATNFTILGKNN